MSWSSSTSALRERRVGAGHDLDRRLDTVTLVGIGHNDKDAEVLQIFVFENYELKSEQNSVKTVNFRPQTIRLRSGCDPVTIRTRSGKDPVKDLLRSGNDPVTIRDPIRFRLVDRDPDRDP
jgi:hypothetical protein